MVVKNLNSKEEKCYLLLASISYKLAWFSHISNSTTPQKGKVKSIAGVVTLHSLFARSSKIFSSMCIKNFLHKTSSLNRDIECSR